MEREIDRRIGAASAVVRSMYRSVVVKKELKQGHDRKDKIPDTGGRNELSPQGGWALP